MSNQPVQFMQRLEIPYSFPVSFQRHTFAPVNPTLVKAIDRLHEKRRHRVMVFIDKGATQGWPAYQACIKRYFTTHRDRLEQVGPIQTLAGGEQAKDEFKSITRVIHLMAQHQLARQDVALIIGGGGILDMVGLAASLVHRGVRVVRMPTTVVGQNDVGVGVKTGIDLHENKNFLGTFAPPFAVINDFDFIERLPDREWIAGVAEAFKVAMIKDRVFFRYLCRHATALKQRNGDVMQHLIIRCAKLHLDHIREGGDPSETGSARPLDFGHWSAHQLELMSKFKIRHGEAVAIGIALDSYYARQMGLIPGQALQALLGALHAAGLSTWHPLLDKRLANGKLAIISGLARFQEHLGGPLTITLPAPVGARREIHEIDDGIIRDGINYLRSFPQC